MACQRDLAVKLVRSCHHHFYYWIVQVQRSVMSYGQPWWVASAAMAKIFFFPGSSSLCLTVDHQWIALCCLTESITECWWWKCMRVNAIIRLITDTSTYRDGTSLSVYPTYRNRIGIGLRETEPDTNTISLTPLQLERGRSERSNWNGTQKTPSLEDPWWRCRRTVTK